MDKSLLQRLRGTDPAERAGELGKPGDEAVLAEWQRSGVKFAASGQRLEEVYYSALRKLMDCIAPAAGTEPVLHEGGVYLGCWLESTGTINAELLSRFAPSVSEATYRQFADYQRADGLMPYKLTAQGPAYRQIQLVTPLARCVWNHYLLNGRNKPFLRHMYQAMTRYDGWLAAYRNTRGTGCVEAFSAFDTGHDLSSRFWHVPDTPHLGDPREYNPDSPTLPFLAPDLTANVICQRTYLAKIAGELGISGDAAEWTRRAAQSRDSLFAHCYDEADDFFYDVDRNGEFVRVQSDNLLRVLACEVGDRELFDRMLRRYLLNTSKFFAKYPFTSIAMDDPRFDPFTSYNTWAGAVNFLSIIRTPHAFEHHRRYVELTWVMYPLVAAMNRMKRFSQALSPWTGEEGYTETYSPAILGVLDFVERLCGILPTAEGDLWFTGLVPYPLDHGTEIAERTAYARTVDGVPFELVNTLEGCAIYRDGQEHIRFPFGTRAVTDREGRLKELIGMSVRTVQGTVSCEGREYPVSVKGNERLAFEDGGFRSVSDIGVVAPAYR
ncbi:MGH1-like glycoside hydrolase domain-containing protein [Paenibacillus humicola]|uniref:MGH1-like glycoside hydrolase domain-containing protein n=1 Tax=Paenibacillus humicola TaxID=3110540 RepID=UPI00237C2712|nr:hypothetical protein [Paenibacillus humicola]